MDKSGNINKRVGPTLVLILLIFFILVQTGAIIYAFKKEGLGVFWTIILLVTPFAIIAALISVYLERMKEIKEDEKEDLSKY